MKTLISSLFCLFTISFTYAQDLSDAIRYSNVDTQGTARFKSMAGAFGALGGDISGVSINPAGAAIFNTSQGALTASNINRTNDVSYGNTMSNRSDNNFDLNQIGAAFVFRNRSNSTKWNKFVVSLFYEKLQDYNSQFLAAGTTNKSISSYFLDNANGLKLGNIRMLQNETVTQAYADIGANYGYQHQQAFLGFEGGILEPVDINDENNIAYTSNIANGNFAQEYSYESSGYNGKFSVNVAGQYSDNIYLGLNINSHFIDFSRKTFLIEENNNTGSTVNSVNFENQLFTKGEGFSLQLGTIIKLSEAVRAGVSYSTPTWLTLREETTQYLSTLNTGDNQRFLVNPSIINIFPDYKLRTPSELSGSLAYIFNKSGLISFDYSRKNYAGTRYNTNNDQLDNTLNNQINNTFKVANNFRVGAEYRYKNMSFRGGYRLQESPYKNTSFMGDLKGYSLGFGYNFGNTRLDLAYENMKQNMARNLYEAGNLDNALLNTNNSVFTLSLNMNL